MRLINDLKMCDSITNDMVNYSDIKINLLKNNVFSVDNITEYLDNWDDIKNGNICYKVLYNHSGNSYLYIYPNSNKDITNYLIECIRMCLKHILLNNDLSFLSNEEANCVTEINCLDSFFTCAKISDKTYLIQI